MDNTPEQKKSVHTELVFNMDDVGFSRNQVPKLSLYRNKGFSDTKIESIPPEGYDATLTMVDCVNLAGGWLPPLIVITRKTLPWELLGEVV